MLIKALNTLDKQASQSFLSMGETSGVGTLRVRNINSFSPSWAIQIGRTGEETSEVKMLGTAAVSGTSVIITGTTTYDHQPDTPVYAIKFDQVIFKRSTAGTAGTATAMTGGTVTITPDGTVTVFDDTTAASSYAYKTTFYNSVTGETSSDSDWITPSGFTFYSLAGIRRRIKAKLFLNNIIKNDADIDDWINEWLEQLTNVAIDVNKDYLLGTADVGFGTSGLGTITATDFKAVRKLWVTYDSGASFAQAFRMENTSFFPNEVFNATRPFFYYQGDTVFGVKPEQSGGTARITYYALSPRLVYDTDELPVSMRGYTKSFVDYGLGQILAMDEKEVKASMYLKNADTDRERFRVEMASRSKTGPITIQMIDAIDAEDGTLEIQ